MNYYDKEDYEIISKEMQGIKNVQWIVSYDNVPEIKELYNDSRNEEYEFIHAVHKFRKGEDVLFF